jgi:hypothetical protein
MTLWWKDERGSGLGPQTGKRKKRFTRTLPWLAIGASLLTLQFVVEYDGKGQTIERVHALQKHGEDPLNKIFLSTVVFITSTSSSDQSWPVPNDWNSLSNTVEVLSHGGNGFDGSPGPNNNPCSGGSGGGGGQYAKKSNVTLTPGGTATYRLRSANSGSSDSQACWFNGTSLAGSSVGIRGQAGGTTNAIGDVKFAGGVPGAGDVGTGSRRGGGGGGAAGPNGAGVAGADGAAGGAGGAANNGVSHTWNSTAGSAASPGAGGLGFAGTGDGDSGGLYGGGGGGGGGLSAGGGGGNGSGGSGRQGLIIVTYTPQEGGHQMFLVF